MCALRARALRSACMGALRGVLTLASASPEIFRRAPRARAPLPPAPRAVWAVVACACVRARRTKVVFGLVVRVLCTPGVCGTVCVSVVEASRVLDVVRVLRTLSKTSRRSHKLARRALAPKQVSVSRVRAARSSESSALAPLSWVACVRTGFGGECQRCVHVVCPCFLVCVSFARQCAQ